jgi:hypothetical protein
MYQVFDKFCKVPTWDSPHPLDLGRFRNALSEVVHRTDFSSEAMGLYIEQNYVQPIWPKDPAELRLVIDRLVEEADAAVQKLRTR